MRLALLLAPSLAVSSLACSTAIESPPSRADAGPPIGLPPDAAPPPPRVYAHTRDTLYRVDPESFELTEIGAFQWPGEDDVMTDLALDGRGDAYGISFDALYRVDLETAEVTRAADLGLEFNGLTFTPGAPDDHLLAMTQDGQLFEIDRATGTAGRLGDLGSDDDGVALSSAGDLVSIGGVGTFAAVRRDAGDAGDLLARIDPRTGQATVLGPTQHDGQILGLGYWSGGIYGFTLAGEVALLDRDTGAVQEARAAPGAPAFWGAGVSTQSARR